MSMDNIEYRPYRSHAWFAPFIAIVGIFSYLMAGAALPNFCVATTYLGMGLLCTFLTRFLCNSAQTIIRFESKKLTIVTRGNGIRRFILGEELAFGYYIRNYKGHLFLVLSPESVIQTNLKKIVCRSANRSEVCIDSVVVIYMDSLQDTIPIKKIVFETVQSVLNEEGKAIK